MKWDFWALGYDLVTKGFHMLYQLRDFKDILEIDAVNQGKWSLSIELILEQFVIVA